jgi:HupE / UreJ protein
VSAAAARPRSSGARSAFGVVLLALLHASGVHAHQVGLSRGTWLQTDQGVDAELVFARGEAQSLCPTLDADRDGALTEAELSGALTVLQGCVVADIEAQSDGGACPGAALGASLTEEDGFALRASFSCDTQGRITVDLGKLLARASAGHRHLGRVTTAQVQNDVVAFSASPAFSFGEAKKAPPVRAYLWIGVEHILFGFDHLVFLLGLVLVGGRLRALIAVVTAFTLAHSVSLALSVLGLVVPSGGLIEPLIAASIAYVGIENFFIKDAAKRWRITAPFGLIHGFGFAGALAQLGVPQDAVAPALFLFNVGVELGQVAVLALVLPLVWLAKTRAPAGYERIKRVLSTAIIVAGLYWLAERLFFSS